MNHKLITCIVITLGLSACVPSAVQSGSEATVHGGVSVRRDVKGGWFNGMIHPPHVIPALPSNFIIVSAAPETKKSREFDMYRGVIWAPERTARQYEFGSETNLQNAKDPMFFVRLSSSVGQYPGTDRFTDEKNLVGQCRSLGLKNLKTAKNKWGAYPVFSVTGNRSDGSTFYMAWIGINSRDGWTIVVDYRVPMGADHPTKEEQQIWENFLTQTKPI